MRPTTERTKNGIRRILDTPAAKQIKSFGKPGIKYSKEEMEKNIITINGLEWEQVKANSIDGIAKAEILYKKHNNKGYLVILSYSNEYADCITDWEEMKQTIKLK